MTNRLKMRSTPRESLKEALENLASSQFSGSDEPSKKGGLSKNDEHVIRADVHRSVSFWDIHKFVKTSHRIRRRKALNDALHDILESKQEFKYYQGLHDVCLVVLELVGGNKGEAVRLLRPFLLLHFKAFLTSDFGVIIPLALDCIKTIVKHHDPELDDEIESCGVGYNFAIPWLLTWFSHNLDAFEDVCSVFDFVLRKKDIISIHHVCAAFLLEGRDIFLQELNSGLTTALGKTTSSVLLGDALRRAEAVSSSSIYNYQLTVPSTDQKDRRAFLGNISLILAFVACICASYVALTLS